MKTIVTKLRREPEGHWTARVSRGGSTVEVNNRHGAWEAVVKEDGQVWRRELLPQIAAAVQDRLPREAKRRR